MTLFEMSALLLEQTKDHTGFFNASLAQQRVQRDQEDRAFGRQS